MIFDLKKRSSFIEIDIGGPLWNPVGGPIWPQNLFLLFKLIKVDYTNGRSRTILEIVEYLMAN